MPYIGNSPPTSYTAMTKQDLTGSSGSSVTLSYAVANANEVALYINNVRQEPTESYTVNGSTLNFNGYTVSASDDIYVIFLGKAIQTVVPPDGSVSTAKIADDAVTSAKLDTNIAIDGDLTVDTSTLKVDSTNNRVGIGNSSPSQKLDVVGSSANIRVAESGGGDLRMNVSGSSGAIGTHSNHPLLFRTNSTERSRIDGNGNIMFGSSSQLNAGKISVLFNGASQNGLILKNTHTNGNHVEFVNSSGTAVGNINQTVSNTVSYNTSSDHRLKENVVEMTDATTRLKQLQPKRFNFIADADTTVDGFLAHEVQTVVPEAITGTHNEVDDDGNPIYQGIDQSKLVPLLVKTIQELEARITALENS